MWVAVCVCDLINTCISAVPENTVPHLHPQPQWRAGAMLQPSPDGYFVEAVPMESKRVKRVACTCPNCANGVNARAINPDGTLKKKKHICHYPGCGKVYGKTSHLRSHLRLHTGERPYMCMWPQCGKKFTRSDELQRHNRTHTGEKRFCCSLCGKKFMRSDHLNKHIKTHMKPANVDDDDENESNADLSQSPGSEATGEMLDIIGGEQAGFSGSQSSQDSVDSMQFGSSSQQHSGSAVDLGGVSTGELASEYGLDSQDLYDSSSQQSLHTTASSSQLDFLSSSQDSQFGGGGSGGGGSSSQQSSQSSVDLFSSSSSQQSPPDMQQQQQQQAVVIAVPHDTLIPADSVPPPMESNLMFQLRNHNHLNLHHHHQQSRTVSAPGLAHPPITSSSSQPLSHPNFDVPTTPQDLTPLPEAAIYYNTTGNGGSSQEAKLSGLQQSQHHLAPPPPPLLTQIPHHVSPHTSQLQYHGYMQL